MSVAVQAVTQVGTITRISVAVTPANLTQDLTYTSTSGTFTGTLVVPVGTQTITATAYVGTTSVGTGSATVTVTANETASVQLRILDSTGAPDVPDHVPYITSLVVPKKSLFIDEEITLTATAVDVDDDPITYQWTQVCTEGMTGTFSAPTEANTTWSAGTQGTCTLKLTVTAATLTDAKEVELLVLDAGSGAVSVTGKYVPQPVISSITLDDSTVCRGTGDWPCTFEPASSTFRNSRFPTQKSRLSLRVNNITSDTDVPTVSVSDDCGGTYGSASSGFSGGSWNFAWDWTAPSTAAVCTITATATLFGLSDHYPVTVLVTGCVDDSYEPNDGVSSSYDLWSLYTPVHLTGLYAHDDDWYTFPVSGGLVSPALSVTLSTTDSIEVELYASDKSTVLASGTNGLTAQLPAAAEARSYYLHVKPGAAAPSCASGYDLSIAVQ